MRRIALGLTFLTAFAAAAPADTVAPADVLALRVTDWLPVDGELREWTAITGNYIVASDGTASFPYVGQIAVAGLLPSKIGDLIAEELKDRFALADRPFASISIFERQPVLVGGAVRTPGEVPFSDGMTARHAIALAGGIESPSGSEGSAMVQALTAEAQIRILSDQEAAETFRVARLRAELDGASVLPATNLPDDPETRVATLRADAERLLALRQERLAREIELVDGRITLLNEEIVALESKQKVLERQRTLSEEARASIADLAERGLAANVRLMDAESTLVTVETQVLDVATALLRARQQAQVAKSERLQLVEGRAAEIMLELEAAETELSAIRERLDLQRSLAAFLSADLGGEASALAMSVTVYRTDGRTIPLTDGPDTVLQPGDLVEVALPVGRQPASDG